MIEHKSRNLDVTETQKGHVTHSYHFTAIILDMTKRQQQLGGNTKSPGTAQTISGN